MIAHTTLAVADYRKSKRFYIKALAPLGYRNNMEFGEAASARQVEAFHEAALAAGAQDNGGPGYRDYWPGHYAAFVHDPDGHNIEAVWYDYGKVK
jgi:catechol 2,3-dioxygenase-like lactoylglutathione lyase family enzyme